MKSDRSPVYERELAREVFGISESLAVGQVRVSNRMITWCDAHFSAMFGYEMHELVGKPIRLIQVSDEAHGRFWDAALSVVARGEIFRTESPQRRKDGTSGWFDISIHRSTHDSEEHRGAFIDISARRRVLLEALKAEEHYRTLFVAMSEGVCVHARDGQITEANPAAERILGLSREQLLGKTPRHPHWQAIREDGTPFPGNEHPASVTLRTGQALNQTIMGVRARGFPLRWISINSQPVFDAGNAQPAAAVVTFIDITAQRSLADKARSARTQLNAILDHVPALIGYWNRELRCQFVNRAFLQGFGLSADEIVGKLLQESPRTTLDAASAHQALVGSLRHAESALTKTDGTTGYIDAFYVPDVDPQGSVRGLFFMGSDITAYRVSIVKTRKLLRHLESVRDSERTNIALALHEAIARTMRAAKFDLGHLKNRPNMHHPGDDEESRRALSDAVVACVENIRQIANGLRPSISDPMDAYIGIAEYARGVEMDSGLRITVTTATALPALDPSTRSLIFGAAREALTNVLRHARATSVTITLAADETKLTLEVVDDGIGFEPGDAPKTSSRGLIRIGELLEGFGGELRVTRTEGGTRFRARTPFGRE